MILTTIIRKTISKENNIKDFCGVYKTIDQGTLEKKRKLKTNITNSRLVANPVFFSGTLTNIAPSKKENICYKKNPFINKSFIKVKSFKIKKLRLTKVSSFTKI